MTKVYRSEKPCKHGHEPIRYLRNDLCVHCAKEAVKRNRVKSIVTWDLMATGEYGKLGKIQVEGFMEDFPQILQFAKMLTESRIAERRAKIFAKPGATPERLIAEGINSPLLDLNAPPIDTPVIP
jgi:hypothetical protein